MAQKGKNQRDTFAGVKIEYLGGIENIDKGESITGSCTLFRAQDTQGKKVDVVIDFGTHQSGEKSYDLNNTVDPRLVKADYIIITHAHIDHIGRLPMLIKAGFKGKIFMTNYTKSIGEYSLLDSARLMESESQEIERRNKQKRKRYQDALRYLHAQEKLNGNNLKKGEKDSLRNRISQIEQEYVEGLDDTLEKIKKYDISSNERIEEILRKQREPLYTKEDVEKLFIPGKYIQILEPGSFTHLKLSSHRGAKDIREKPCIEEIILEFLPAVHIIGSVQAEIRVKTSQILQGAKRADVRHNLAEEHRYLFSGDLGREDPGNFVGNLQMPEGDYVYAQVESTYASRDHPEREDSIQQFFEVLSGAKHDIVIPAFSIQRTQDVGLLLLRYYDEIIQPQITELKEKENEIERIYQESKKTNSDQKKYQEEKDYIASILSRLEFEAYFDSVLGNKVTQIFAHAYSGRYANLTAEAQIKKYGKILLHFVEPNDIRLEATESSRKTFDVNDESSSETSKRKIIVSSGGMCEGGPIISHLERHISNANSTIIFMGYTPPTTLGGSIKQASLGEDSVVLIEGKAYKVYADIHDLGGFSGHAGEKTLLSYTSKFKNGTKIALTHGGNARWQMREKMKKPKGGQILLPANNDRIELSFTPDRKSTPIRELNTSKVVHFPEDNQVEVKVTTIGGIKGLQKAYTKLLKNISQISNTKQFLEKGLPIMALIANEDFNNLLDRDSETLDQDIWDMIERLGKFFNGNVDYEEIIVLDEIESTIQVVRLDRNMIHRFYSWEEKEAKKEKRLKNNDSQKEEFGKKQVQLNSLRASYQRLVTIYKNGDFSIINEMIERTIRDFLCDSFFNLNQIELSSELALEASKGLKKREGTLEEIAGYHARKKYLESIKGGLERLQRGENDIDEKFLLRFLDDTQLKNETRSQKDKYRNAIDCLRGEKLKHISKKERENLMIEINTLIGDLQTLKQKLLEDDSKKHNTRTKIKRLEECIGRLKNLVESYREKKTISEQIRILRSKISSLSPSEDLEDSRNYKHHLTSISQFLDELKGSIGDLKGQETFFNKYDDLKEMIEALIVDAKLDEREKKSLQEMLDDLAKITKESNKQNRGKTLLSLGKLGRELVESGTQQGRIKELRESIRSFERSLRELHYSINKSTITDYNRNNFYGLFSQDEAKSYASILNNVILSDDQDNYEILLAQIEEIIVLMEGRYNEKVDDSSQKIHKKTVRDIFATIKEIKSLKQIYKERRKDFKKLKELKQERDELQVQLDEDTKLTHFLLINRSIGELSRLSKRYQGNNLFLTSFKKFIEIIRELSEVETNDTRLEDLIKRAQKFITIVQSSKNIDQSSQEIEKLQFELSGCLDQLDISDGLLYNANSEITFLQRQLDQREITFSKEHINRYVRANFYGLSPEDVEKHKNVLKEFINVKKSNITPKEIQQSKAHLQSFINKITSELRRIDEKTQELEVGYLEYTAFSSAKELKNTLLEIFKGILLKDYYDRLASKLAEELTLEIYTQLGEGHADISSIILDYLLDSSAIDYIDDTNISELQSLKTESEMISKLIEDTFVEGRKDIMNVEDIEELRDIVLSFEEQLEVLGGLKEKILQA